MKFGLMFFAASEDSLGPDKYRLVIESARFGDREGFSSVWVPERHFTAFGGLYPNPAVLHAGLATCTSRIRLNAGSVVAPLHHPIRIAEEWSVVDNLSNGRVGLSFAAGWNPNDFVLAPDRYADRNEQVLDVMHHVQRLWRGEAYTGGNGVGQPADVRIFPKPVQDEVPVWLTVAGNPSNFERAGSCGANLLTHLLDQDEATLASKIRIYREAREAAGFDPATGIVSLMIHTLVGDDADVVREQARRPYCNYIKANIGLFKGLAQSRGRDADLSAMSESDLDEFTNFLYERFAATRGLIGTPESCAPLVARLEQIGVSELACLLDFGPDVDLILASLPNLARLRTLCGPAHGAFDRAAVLARCTDARSGDAFHRVLDGYGVRIAGAFQPVRTVWRRPGEALAHLVLPAADRDYHVHPASLDACGRILAAALPDFGRDRAGLYMPTGVETCELPGALTGEVWVHAVVTTGTDGPLTALSGDVMAYDQAGRLVARLGGVRLSRVESQAPTIDTMSLLYERIWQMVPAASPALDAHGRWHVVGDGDALETAIRVQIEAAGGECVSTIDTALRGIVYARGCAATTAPDEETAAIMDEVEAAVRGALDMVRASGSTPVWMLTRGAMAVSDGGRVAVTQVPLWGFGRALAVERPGALGALVDLDPAAAPVDAARQALQVILGDRAEDMVVCRSDGRYVPRLRRYPVSVANGGPTTETEFGADETVLVSGGTGGLGVLVAEWLAARGVRHLLLAGRHAPTDEVADRLQHLRASGVDVEAVQVDVADYSALQLALDTARVRHPALTAVFHLAGVLDDGRLEEQTWDRVAGVLNAKVAGAWNLHRLTAGMALKHFVMFSSVSSLVPAPGQSGYAAANAFLDGLAHYRRAMDQTALVVNWGPWAGAGHASTNYGGQAHARLASLGIGSLTGAQGLRALETLMAQGHTQAAAAVVDWERLVVADPATAGIGLLSDLVTPAVVAGRGRTQASSALVDTLLGLSPAERRPHLLGYLSDLVTGALKLRIDGPIDAQRRLFEIGLDSILALELKGTLERALGVPLSATLLFVHPTLDALCDHILTGVVSPAVVAVEAGQDDGATEEALTRRLFEEIEASRGS
jgi:natural product biosynthesis luciferase-like monooxygenase protein